MTVTRTSLKFRIIFLLLLIPSLVFGQKTLVLQDKTYEPQIRSVQCYPNQASEGNQLLPPVARMDIQNLMLEFDDLQEQRSNYYARLIHCNADWSASTLMDLDFLHDYNETTINDYSFSINTHIPYVHYRFPIPAVKIPGNYVLMVYRDGNRKDLVLTRRFMIFDGRISLSTDDNLAGLGNLRSTNQALNFKLDYGATEIINPMGNIHVTIRQNQRWDNAKEDVKPSFVREDVGQLEYRFFDMDKTFQGGNEFRFVDFRSMNYPGMNTYRLDKSHKPYELSVNMDYPRSGQAYSQYPDMNGGFVPDNTDYPQEPWISAQYLYVTFGLKSTPYKGDVHLIGAYNGFARTDENKMQWENGLYTKRILLKQGFYNYAYWTSPPEADGNQVEGNYFQTENLYEVLVYYRAFQPNADLLIGYFVIPVNPR